MISLHLKKNLKPRNLIILTLLLLVPVAISYYFTNLDYREWVSTYEKNPSDVNLQTVEKIINGHNGLTYFFKFIFATDAIIIFCLLFSTASILFIGSSIIDDLTNGNGTLIVSRISFKKYLQGNIKAQIFFNFTCLFYYPVFCELSFLR